jgi:tRNA-specific 2-thiouridylase
MAAAVAELVGDELVVRLRVPLRGVARGQTLVLYRPDPDGDEVLGSATIAGTSR